MKETIHRNLKYLFTDYIRYNLLGVIKNYDMPFAKADIDISINFKTYLKYRFGNEWCNILSAAWGIAKRELAMQVKELNDISGFLRIGLSLSNNFFIKPKD